MGSEPAQAAWREHRLGHEQKQASGLLRFRCVGLAQPETEQWMECCRGHLSHQGGDSLLSGTFKKRPGNSRHLLAACCWFCGFFAFSEVLCICGSLPSPPIGGTDTSLRLLCFLEVMFLKAVSPLN